jgi:maltose O-acetyltransferase
MRALGYSLTGPAEIAAGHRLLSKRITFGHNVFVNVGLYYDGLARVTVGNNVAFGPYVRLITATHEIGPAHKRCTSTAQVLPIVIEAGCWIAAGATLLPGVTVRRGCVVGSGAVVTQSTEPNGLYAGVPARRIRDLSAT